MCGVATIYAYHYASPSVDRDELRLIRDYMAKRGPDGVGEWFSSDGRVAMGHRRLSIIDLSDGGSQPMRSQDGLFTISFNGEIYNHKHLRQTLEAEGCRFASNADTEVLLHLYAKNGVRMLDDLRGMFAFTIWDQAKDSLFLARDPYGIKPLYYADDGWTLRAASQVKALLASPRVSRMPEPAGAAGFFLTGSVPEPFTLFQEIRQVPAGCYVIADASGPAAPKRYFSIAKVYGEAERGRDVAVSPVADSLLDSVRSHFVSDVSVGIFLSSGMDSSALLALAADAGVRKFETLTLGFEEFKGTAEDELPLAKKIAGHYGMRHHVRIVTGDEARLRLPDFFAAMDQPSIDGFNTYLVSLAASEIGLKVALSGVGADELFGGYPSFNQIPLALRFLALPSKVPLLDDLYFTATAFLPSRYSKARGLLRLGGSYSDLYLLKRGLFMPWELPSLMGREEAREGLRRLRWGESVRQALASGPVSPFGKISTLESSFYMKNQLLRDADWAGMAHSVEIRTPYVDARLLRALAPYLIRRKNPGKKELAQSPSNKLPDAWVRRPKTGFGVPIRRWFESEKGLDGWRRVPILKRDCHPLRRWAYTVWDRMGMG